MRITFIGTSHGAPEPNRKCSCTMLEIQGRYYFIDMGTSPLDHMITAGISPDAVRGIFITHMHGDHTNGLLQFICLACSHFKTVDPAIFLPRPEGVKTIEEWLNLNDTPLRALPFGEVRPGVIYNDGLLQVTAIPTLHIEHSYAFFLEAEGKSVLFTGDLRHPDRDFPAIAKERETELLVCESAHFSATDYLPHLRKCKTKQIYVNHYQGWRIPSILQLAGEMGAIPVKPANDGSEIVL